MARWAPSPGATRPTTWPAPRCPTRSGAGPRRRPGWGAWSGSTTTCAPPCVGRWSAARPRRPCAWGPPWASCGGRAATSRRGGRAWRRCWRCPTRAREPRGRAARSSVLISAARLARTRGDYAEARALLQQSLALALALGDRQRAGVARYHLGMALRDAGEADAARPLFEASLAAGRALGDERLVCGALFGLGFVALHAGDGATAWRLAQESWRWRVRPAGTSRSPRWWCWGRGHRPGRLRAGARPLPGGPRGERSAGQPGLPRHPARLPGRPAGRRGQPARALRLYGAADALNARLGARLDATRRAWRARWLPVAEGALPAAAREGAWAAGRALATEEAVADALQYLSRPDPPGGAGAVLSAGRPVPAARWPRRTPRARAGRPWRAGA